jgi:phosphoribosyl 1,2-cyclic phosphodiesterase
MSIKVWGARGSIPTPGPGTNRYGGNTSCVQVTLSDGSIVVLDAGSGARNLGAVLATQPARISLLLTHLHLDHVLGLIFFAPCFMADTELTIWGPRASNALHERVARYISDPLAPLGIGELPGKVTFREVPDRAWHIGPARITAAPVTHRGTTLGYRIEDAGASLVYLPDHEPAISPSFAARDEDRISGYDLAAASSLLIHDCQYADHEYPNHIGWGHSRLSDTLAFGQLTDARKLLLFHHDPSHDDPAMDRLYEQALDGWESLGRHRDDLLVARELQELTLAPSD